MSNILKKLAGQTAIYGLPSIVGRFLNYLLVPLHTSAHVFSTDQYGIITEMYSYVAFFVILLTYGMETAFFRFSTLEQHSHKKKVYSTVLYALFTTSILFIIISSVFNQSIATYLKYPDNGEFVIWFAFIVGLDALSSIPLAKLRTEENALQFSAINFINILINISLNLFFLSYCLPKYQAGEINWIVDTFYNPEIGVGYVFISNLIASVVKFILLSPKMIRLKEGFSFTLFKEMLAYGLPLLIFGLAIIVNETLDKIMLKWMLFDTFGRDLTMSKIGVYGACYKLSIIITLFIQAFRYAAEPFFFAKAKDKNSNMAYAEIMTYFIIICSVIFLGVMLYIDIIKQYINNKDYWVGLNVVPILLMANVSLGIYFNLSIWYKLTNKTMYGAYIGIAGAFITILLNYLWIPIYGYYGSAWATLICYTSMVVISYFFGQKHMPVPYQLKKIFLYLTLSIGCYLLSRQMIFTTEWLKYTVHSFIFIGFLFVVYLLEIKHLFKKYLNYNI